MATTMIDLLVRFEGFKIRAVEDRLDVQWGPGSHVFALEELELSQDFPRIHHKLMVWYLPCFLQ